MTSPCPLFYREIPLSQGQSALVDAEDYDFLMQWKWYAMYSKETKTFYALRRTGSKGKTLIMARVIIERYETIPPGHHVDHKKPWLTLDNRKENIRIASPSQNQANKRTQKNNKSGCAGVMWESYSSKWVASVKFQGRYTFKRRFADYDLAVAARKEAMHRTYGAFSRQNEIA